MFKIALLALLLAFAASQTTYTFPYSGLYNTLYAPPSFALNTLYTGEVLNINVTIPDAVGSQFRLQLRDGNNNQFATPIVIPLTAAGSLNYTIQASGMYRLVVVSVSQALTVSMFYLTVQKNGATPPLLQVVDVLRSGIVKFIWLDQTTNLTIVSKGNTPTLYAMSTSNKWSQVATLTGSSHQSVDTTTYTYLDVPKGYYTITASILTGFSSGYLEFSTNAFPCPYSGYTDVYSIFTGCFASSTSASIGYTTGFPCTLNDFSTGKCLNCLLGYTLSDGKCLFSPNCGPRQFINYGQCYDVNPDCNTFNLYTGFCTSCIRSDHVLKSGLCMLPGNIGEITCAPGTHSYLYYCLPDGCAVGYINGTCTQCVNVAFQLTFQGVCTPINCGTGFYYSISVHQCLIVPEHCTKFSLINQKCQGCALGYFLNSSSLCEQPTASLNCKSFDTNNNKCLECNPGYIPSNGRCYASTVVPQSCGQGQILILSTCVNLPANCASLDASYQCNMCNSGYRLQSRSCIKCTGSNSLYPCSSCPSGQYVDQNGRCIQYGLNCLSVHPQTGMCVSCINGAAPLGGKCCYYGEVLSNGICVSSSGSQTTVPGQVVRDSLYFIGCASSDPVRKECIVCKLGYNFVSGTDYCTPVPI